MGLKRLVEEFGLTHEAAAKAVGRSRSAVTNLLRLTSLAKPAQEYLLNGGMEMGHARAMLALPLAQQAAMAARVVNGQLSVRETERLVAAQLSPAKREARRNAAARPRYRYRAPGNRARGKTRRQSQDRASAARAPANSSSHTRASNSWTGFSPSCVEHPAHKANTAAREPPFPLWAIQLVGASAELRQHRIAAGDLELAGPSMFSVFTTPSSTSIEKRWQRTPMPRAMRSSSRPERLRVIGAAVAHHAHFAAGLLVARPRAHHERVVDRHAEDVVDPFRLQLVVVREIRGHVLSRAGRRERARQAEDDDLLASGRGPRP